MRRLLSNKKFQFAANGGFGVVLLVVAFFSARHFMRSGWPLHHADPLMVGASALLFFIAYAFKAWGWQRLFAKHERPSSSALAFAGGAACVGGIALPGRIDDAVRIAIVKRFPGTRCGLGTVGLSLLVLGMLDNAALTPLASVAAVSSSSMLVRAGFLVVAVAGVLAALSRRLSSHPREAGARDALSRGPLARLAYALHEGGAGRLALRLRLVGPARHGGLPAAERAVAQGLLRTRARLPLRLRRIGRVADRTRGCSDAGRCRRSDSHGERHEGHRGARVLRGGSGARDRHRRRRDAAHHRVADRPARQAALPARRRADRL